MTPEKILHYIGGKQVPSVHGLTFGVADPVSNQVYAQVAAGGAEDVDRAVEAAATAFAVGPWPGMAARARAKILNRIADGIETRGASVGRQGAQRSQQRGQVEPSVEAPRQHEIAIGDAEPGPKVGDTRSGRPGSTGRRAGLDRPREGGPRCERHDAEAVASEVKHAASGTGRGRRPDDHGRGVAQDPPPQPLSEPAGRRPLVGLGQLPRREVEERDDERQTGSDRERPATDGVIDGPTRASAFSSPGRTDGRTAEHERIDGHRSGTQQPGRRELPATDHLEVRERGRRVVEVRADQECEGLARQRCRVEGAEESV